MSREPFAFQNARARGYFEGWYFKNVAATGEAWSFIPGVSRNADGTRHAFIQVIRGRDGETAYQRYPIEDFSAATDHFEVEVRLSHFGWRGIRVDLPDLFGGIHGVINYGPPTRPTSRAPRWGRPAIMGWYRLIPGMECYHEVGSVDHVLHGTLTVGGTEIEFDEGRGYLEKDWGRSMPSAWIWSQCNSFTTPGASFMISIARIPWIGRSFVGHLGFVRHPALADGEVQLFGTWSGARVEEIEVAGETVRFVLSGREFSVEVVGTRSHTGSLAAPVAGAMDRRIAESLDATLEITIRDRSGAIVATEAGRPAGLELVGDLASLGADVSRDVRDSRDADGSGASTPPGNADRS